MKIDWTALLFSKSSHIRLPLCTYIMLLYSCNNPQAGREKVLHLTWVAPYRDTTLVAGSWCHWHLCGYLFRRCVYFHVIVTLLRGELPLRVACYFVRVVITLVCPDKGRQKGQTMAEWGPAHRKSSSILHNSWRAPILNIDSHLWQWFLLFSLVDLPVPQNMFDFLKSEHSI